MKTLSDVQTRDVNASRNTFVVAVEVSVDLAGDLLTGCGWLLGGRPRLASYK